MQTHIDSSYVSTVDKNFIVKRSRLLTRLHVKKGNVRRKVILINTVKKTKEARKTRRVGRRARKGFRGITYHAVLDVTSVRHHL